MNIPLGQFSGSDATDQLRQSVEKIAADSDRQNRRMVRMTLAILLLTVLIAALTAGLYWKSP